MPIARLLALTINPSHRTIAAILVLANVTVALLWQVGIDEGAMTVLFVPLLFAQTAFLCYLLNPVDGKKSAIRGYIVGGLSVVIWLPWVVVRSWIERGELSHPNWAWLMLPPFLVFGTLFGAAVGSMAGVIGGVVLRAIGTFFNLVMKASAGSKTRRSGKDTDCNAPQFL